MDFGTEDRHARLNEIQKPKPVDPEITVVWIAVIVLGLGVTYGYIRFAQWLGKLAFDWWHG